jgi:hypothetical protein
MTTDRSQYIAGLRELADLLEQHDELRLPYHGSSGNTPVAFHFFGGDDPKSEFVAAARLVPGKLDKSAWAQYFDLETTLGGPDGLRLVLSARRNDVCERVVTGVETVTRHVPDPDAEVPLVEVTEQVEQVEWVCRPLLPGGAS